jgi:hypothetical protein
MRVRTQVLPIFVIVVLLGTALPATAHDPELHDHPGPGSEGPDEHSQNIKLMSNVPGTPGVTNSDLAFDGKLAYAGNYAGFRILDISSPARPRILADFHCNGAQGDVSIFEGLLFQSVDTPQSHPGCDSTNVTAATEGMFEGIRIFDVSDPAAPEHVASIQTDCGSHTHTILPEPENGRVLVGARAPGLDVPDKGHFVGAHLFLLFVPPEECERFCFVQAVKRTVTLDGTPLNLNRDWRLDLLPNQPRRPPCYHYQRERPEGRMIQLARVLDRPMEIVVGE